MKEDIPSYTERLTAGVISCIPIVTNLFLSLNKLGP